MKDKPRIAIISLGGTWCMKRQKQADTGKEIKVAESLGKGFDFNESFPIAAQLCHAYFIELDAIDSSNLTPTNWTKLAKFLSSIWNEYDGFVIMQGTDTLAFTAASQAFALRNIDKPVIFSGAQLEMDAPGSDAHSNLTNAVRVAVLRYPQKEHLPALSEVAVMFGSRIIRGTRCRKYSECDLEAFSSVNIPDLGRIRIGIHLNDALCNNHQVYGKKQNSSRFYAAEAFDTNVTLIHLYPGFSPKLLYEIGKRSSGLILASFGAGNIPSSSQVFKNDLSLEEPITQLVNEGIPVGITTQCVVGQAEIGMYETGSAAQKAGAMILNDMTPETAFVKLAWLLANESQWTKEAIRAKKGTPGLMVGLRIAMCSDYAGEITENSALYNLYGVF